VGHPLNRDRRAYSPACFGGGAGEAGARGAEGPPKNIKTRDASRLFAAADRLLGRLFPTKIPRRPRRAPHLERPPL